MVIPNNVEDILFIPDDTVYLIHMVTREMLKALKKFHHRAT